MRRNLIYAISVLVGTVVGVGIFGLPYIASKTGFFIMIFYLVFLGIIVAFVNFAYAEIICSSKGEKRLVGYSEEYLGKTGKIVSILSTLLSFWGCLLVYLIVAGDFLNILFNQYFSISRFGYSLLFWIFNAVFIYLGIKSIAQVELFMTILLLFVVGIIFKCSYFQINISYLQTYNFKQLFLPYGAVLFSLTGASAIPEIASMLNKDRILLKKTIKWGAYISIVLYILFVAAIVGVTGSHTTEDAIAGLAGRLDSRIVLLGALFGILAIATSFLTLGLNLKHIFEYDFGFSHFISWILVVFAPLILLLLGFSKFIAIISLIGAIGGIDGVLIMMIYNKIKKKQAKKKSFFNLSVITQFGIACLFLLGIVYQFIY